MTHKTNLKKHLVPPMDQESSDRCRDRGARTYCVTGASGYIGSWLVKIMVTPFMPLSVILLALWRGGDSIRLFKTDLDDEGSFDDAVYGCHGVFHVAASMEPVIQSTDDVLPALNSRMGSMALVHTEDICNAHLFLMKHDQAEGRYICCTNSCTMSELVDHFAKLYPSLNSQRIVEAEMGSVPTEISSKKLKDLGFRYIYELHEVIYQTVDYCIDHVFLPPIKRSKN